MVTRSGLKQRIGAGIPIAEAHSPAIQLVCFSARAKNFPGRHLGCSPSRKRGYYRPGFSAVLLGLLGVVSPNSNYSASPIAVGGGPMAALQTRGLILKASRVDAAGPPCLAALHH